MQKIVSISVLIAVLCLGGNGGVEGSVITWFTPAGATIGGLPVAVEATFTTSPDAIAVTVDNTLINPRSVTQNLTGLGFVLSTGQTAGSLTSSAGLERMVASNGNFTDGSSVPTGWALDNGFSFQYGVGLKLKLLNTPTAPRHSIIGDPDLSGLYSNANNSLKANDNNKGNDKDPHNPFLQGPVTFEVIVPGVTADTTVTGVQFSFNTSPGSFINVPAPVGLVLLGSGILGLAAWRRRG